MSDLELVQQAQQNDQIALTALYNKYKQKVHYITLGCLRSYPNEIEDVAQDAMAQVLMNLHTFKGGSAFSTWMHTVVTNRCLMHIRHLKAQRSNPLYHADSLTEEAEDSDIEYRILDIAIEDKGFAQLEARLDLAPRLALLPKGYRNAVEQIYLDGATHIQVAAETGRSVGNVKSQKHKGLRACRKLMDKKMVYSENTIQPIDKPAKQKYTPKRCITCSAVFRPTQGAQKYCVECRANKNAPKQKGLGKERGRIAELEKENSRLRSLLAAGEGDCVYCGLSKQDMAKCSHGFPGCARADDLLEEQLVEKAEVAYNGSSSLDLADMATIIDRQAMARGQ